MSYDGGYVASYDGGWLGFKKVVEAVLGPVERRFVLTIVRRVLVSFD